MDEKTEKLRKRKIITEKSTAREIVKEIINFGVNDGIILHVMQLLALNLESREKMLEINQFLKKFTESINTDNNEDTIKLDKPQIIIQ